ncbi:LuxR C-terminal-related transcriptional regulator [Nocardia sp. NPDC004260]
MTLRLPAWLPPAVVMCVAGSFPLGDEDAERRAADAWSDKAEWCRERAEYHEAKAKPPEGSHGDTVAAIADQHRRTADRFRQQATNCDSLARQLYESANATELQKMVIISMAVILALQLARCALMFVAGGPIQAAVAQMATRTAAQRLWMRFVAFLSGRGAELAAERGSMVLLRNGVVMGVAMGGGTQAGAQAVQVAKGDREQMDWTSVGVATAAGAVGGLFGMLFGLWAGPKVATIGANANSTVGRVALQLAGTTMVGAGAGAVGALGGTAVSLALSDQPFSRKAFTEGLIPGIGSGFIGAAAFAAQGMRSRAPLPDTTADPAAAPVVTRREASPGSLVDALRSHGIVTADFDPNNASHTHQQQQIDNLVALLRQTGATADAPVRPTLPLNNADWQPANVPNLSPDNLNPVKSVKPPSDAVATPAEPAPASSTGTTPKAEGGNQPPDVSPPKEYKPPPEQPFSVPNNSVDWEPPAGMPGALIDNVNPVKTVTFPAAAIASTVNPVGVPSIGTDPTSAEAPGSRDAPAARPDSETVGAAEAPVDGELPPALRDSDHSTAENASPARQTPEHDHPAAGPGHSVRPHPADTGEGNARPADVAPGSAHGNRVGPENTSSQPPSAPEHAAVADNAAATARPHPGSRDTAGEGPAGRGRAVADARGDDPAAARGRAVADARSDDPAAGPWSSVRQRGIAADEQAGTRPVTADAHDASAQQSATVSATEEQVAQRVPDVATDPEPAGPELAPAAAQKDSAEGLSSDRDVSPTMTITTDLSPAPQRGDSGPRSPGGDRFVDAAGPQRQAAQPSGGPARPAAGVQPGTPAAGGSPAAAGGSRPPRVSAPKNAAAERPPAVEPVEGARGQAEDGHAPSGSAAAHATDNDNRNTPPAAAEPDSEHGRTADGTTGDETARATHPDESNAPEHAPPADDSAKGQQAKGHPDVVDEAGPSQPKPGESDTSGDDVPGGRASDDSASEQQAKTRSDTPDDAEAPPSEPEPARAQGDSDAPPTARDEDPAADARARARAEVEQRNAAERQQNDLVREHHRQRVEGAAERERAAHAELQRQEEAVRVAEEHERATRVGLGDELRELFGRGTAEDRVQVEAARAAQEQLRQAQARLAECRDAYEAAVAQHDAAARARAHDLVEISDNAGVSLMNDYEAGVLTDRDAVFDVVAQERVRTALDAGRAIGELRKPGSTADGTSPLANASPESLADTMVRGSREERVAAMTEWIRRGDDRHRLVRETQAAAFLLLEHGPVDMKTGEGKTIVMVMKKVSDAIDHGTAHAWTSSDLLAGELAGELHAFVARPESDTGIDVVRMDQDGPLPDPVPGRSRIVVGTKEDYLFRALKVADSMMNELAASGMSHQEVTALRDFLNTKPSIDLIKERLDTAASAHGLDLRYDPFPAGKLTVDEFDTIFDGNSECVLSPGAAEEAPPEVRAELQGIWNRLTTAEREHGLTAADFKRPEHTRGMWAAETTPAAVAKLEKVAGGPVTASELKLYADAANARWGLEKGTHYITRADEGEGAKIGILAHETNDKAMWDRTKSTEVRWQDVGQFVDLKEGLPVRANQEHSLRMSDQQLIGSKLLFDPSGLSGTMKGVEGITYDLYGVGPVPELPTFYTSQRVVEPPKFYENTHAKLTQLARDIVRDAHVVDGEQTGRAQWVVCMDNGEIRGDPDAGRIGLIDLLRTAAREEHGADFELKFEVVDAEFYAEHGGSNADAEALVRQKIEEFGDKGTIYITNKDGGRGADPTPSQEVIDLGGVDVKVSGGPSYSERVNDQVDGRGARGGSGDDREHGGTPGSAVHYVSPEDFLGRVTDHGVTQQIVQYTEAVKAHRAAQEQHEALNTEATRIELNRTETALRNAENNLWKHAVPAMKDAVEQNQLASKYASANQANAPPTDAHGTATRQPQHPPPQSAATAAPHATAPHATAHTPAASHNGTPVPTVAGLAAGAASNLASGNPPVVPNLRDEHGDSTLRHLLRVLDAPGGQAAAPLLPVAQAVRDAAFDQVESQGIPIGADVADHVRETAQNLLHTSLNQLDPAQRQLVTDAGTVLQQGHRLEDAHTAAVAQLVAQVPTAQPVLAAAAGTTVPFDQLPPGDRTETLQRAQQGDRSAAQALDRHFGPATAQAMCAVLSGDSEHGTPPTRIQLLAHAVARATLGAADAGGWQVPPGIDIGDWLLSQARNTWLDSLNHLNPAVRRLVSEALDPRSRSDDLTDAQVTLFGWVAQEIAVRAADSTARQREPSAVNRDRADSARTAEADRKTKQAIARKLFEKFDIEVLGLDKPEISVDTALSIRNAIVDGFAAGQEIKLDVVLVAAMAGNTGACIWTPEGIGEVAPTFMVLNENLFGDPERFRNTMRKAVQAGRLMAPTGDPAYDAVSHEMGHLQDRAARKGLYDKKPIAHLRDGAVQGKDYEDSKEARAFGFLYTHFAEFKKAGMLAPDLDFDDWLGQLDSYSRVKQTRRDGDRLFAAFDIWLNEFKSRAAFDEWLRQSGLSRRDDGGAASARRRTHQGPWDAETEDTGWVDLKSVYDAWLDQLDSDTRSRIVAGEEYNRIRAGEEAQGPEMGTYEPKMGDLAVFNPAEALAEANNAFGRTAPADRTHPAYVLQALLRDIPYFQVLREAEQRNALVQADYRGPVPAASEFGTSIASNGPSASLAARWRAMSPAARADYAEQQIAYLNPDTGFVLDELDRLQAEHRATVTSTPDGTAQKPEPRPDDRSALPPEFWQQHSRSHARAAVPAPIHLGDPDNVQPDPTQPVPDLPRSAQTSRRAAFDSFRRQILAIYVAGPSIERSDAVARALADADPEDLRRALREAGLDPNQQRVLRQFWPGRSDRTAAAVLPDPGEDMDPLLWAAIRRFASAVARVRTSGESPERVVPQPDQTESDAAIPDRGGLTFRELEVLRLSARGLLYPEIGPLMGISHKTVQSYARRACAKLRCPSLIPAVLAADREGWLDEPSGPHIDVEFSPDEVAILQLAANGLDNREIATELATTRYRVRTFMAALPGRLGVEGRLPGLLAAQRQGAFQPGDPHTAATRKDVDLSPREREVLDLVAAGLTDQAIGDQLGVTAATARGYRVHIQAKLGTSDHEELAARARSLQSPRAEARTVELSEFEALLLHLVTEGAPPDALATALDMPQSRLDPLLGQLADKIGARGRIRVSAQRREPSSQRERLEALAESLPGTSRDPAAVSWATVRAFRSRIATRPSELTGREPEVLRLAAQGLSLNAIARTLGGSHATVINELDSIAVKLGTPDRAVLLMAAQRAWSAEHPQPIPEPTADVGLTPQETSVLRLVARRFTNPAISAELGLSVPLVKYIRRGLRTKLGIDDTAGLVAWALHSGIAVDDPADAPDPELQARVTDALRRATATDTDRESTPDSHDASPIPADIDGSGESPSAQPAEVASDPAQTALAEQLGLPPAAVTRGAVRLALTLVAEQTQAMPTAVTGIDGQELSRWIRSQLELHADQEAATHEGALAELERRDGEESGLEDAADAEADPLDQNGFDNRRRALDQKLRALLGLQDLSPPRPMTTGEVLAELYWITSLTDSPELEHLVAASETFLCATLEPLAAVPLDTVQIHTLRSQLAQQVGVADDELTRTHAEVLAADETVAPQTRRLAERYLTLRPSQTEQKPTRADIARLAGVGDSYVSSVFHGRFGAKKPWHGETTQRVLAAAHRLGVPPDRADIAALTDPNFVTRRVRPARWIGDEFVPARIKPQPSRDKLVEAAGTAKATVRDVVKGSGTQDDMRLVRSAADEIGFWYHPDGPMGTVDAEQRATTSGNRNDPVAIDLDPDEPGTRDSESADSQTPSPVAAPVGLPDAAMTVAPGQLPLTERQRAVLTLLAEGKSIAEIAEQLQISEASVKNHTERICRKRRVSNRSELLATLTTRFDSIEDVDIDELADTLVDPGQLPLTERQRAVFTLLAEGMSNTEIAERLQISETAVQTHAERIYQKVGVSDRREFLASLTSRSGSVEEAEPLSVDELTDGLEYDWLGLDGLPPADSPRYAELRHTVERRMPAMLRDAVDGDLAALLRAIAQLPEERQRRFAESYYLHGTPRSRMVRELGIEVNTFKNLLETVPPILAKVVARGAVFELGTDMLPPPGSPEYDDLRAAVEARLPAELREAVNGDLPALLEAIAALPDVPRQYAELDYLRGLATGEIWRIMGRVRGSLRGQVPRTLIRWLSRGPIFQVGVDELPIPGSRRYAELLLAVEARVPSEVAAAMRGDLAALLRAIERLPNESRTYCELVYFGGVRLEEISDALGHRTRRDDAWVLRSAAPRLVADLRREAGTMRLPSASTRGHLAEKFGVDLSRLQPNPLAGNRARTEAEAARALLGDLLGIAPNLLRHGVVRQAVSTVQAQLQTMSSEEVAHAVRGGLVTRLGPWIANRIRLDREIQSSTAQAIDGGALSATERNRLYRGGEQLDSELAQLLGLTELRPLPDDATELPAELYRVAEISDSPEIATLAAALENFFVGHDIERLAELWDADNRSERHVFRMPEPLGTGTTGAQSPSAAPTSGDAEETHPGRRLDTQQIATLRAELAAAWGIGPARVQQEPVRQGLDLVQRQLRVLGPDGWRRIAEQGRIPDVLSWVARRMASDPSVPNPELNQQLAQILSTAGWGATYAPPADDPLAVLRMVADATGTPELRHVVEVVEIFLELDERDADRRPTKADVQRLADVDQRSIGHVLDTYAQRGKPARTEEEQRVLIAAQWFGYPISPGYEKVIDPAFARDRFTPPRFLNGRFLPGSFAAQPSPAKVGRAAGVDNKTVSAVFRGTIAADSDVGRRVLAAADQLGFWYPRAQEIEFAHLHALRTELAELLGTPPRALDHAYVRARLRRLTAANIPALDRITELAEAFLALGVWELDRQPSAVDVAKLAGVHPTAVGKAMNRAEPAHSELEQRILVAAHWLGYEIPAHLRITIDPDFIAERFTPPTLEDGEFVPGTFVEQPTRAQVAQLSGVDQSTVNGVLRGSIPAHTERARRVLTAASALGYWIPNESQVFEPLPDSDAENADTADTPPSRETPMTAATHTPAEVAAALQNGLPGAVKQVLDQIDVELRSMTDAERRDAADRADLTRLPGWVVDRLAHEAKAQELARDTTTPEQRAEWQSRAEEFDYQLAHILGLPQPGTGWTDRISSDPLHHLRALTRRPDAPAELRHLVDTATRCLSLQDIAAAVEPLHRALADWPIAEHTDRAAAIAWELALQARADGGGTPEISAAIHGQTGQRWIEIHVSDDSRTLPARESGNRPEWRAVDLLDTHTETWGWVLPRDSGKQVWFKLFETADTSDPSQPPRELILDLVIPQDSLQRGPYLARRAVRQRLRQAGHPDPYDLTVLVSDLVQNVYRYADQGDARVRIRIDGNTIRVGITDTSRGLPARQEATTQGTVSAAAFTDDQAAEWADTGIVADTHGFFLGMLEAMASVWGVILERAGGKTIWFEVPMPPPTASGTTTDQPPNTPVSDPETPEPIGIDLGAIDLTGLGLNPSTTSSDPDPTDANDGTQKRSTPPTDTGSRRPPTLGTRNDPVALTPMPLT